MTITSLSEIPFPEDCVLVFDLDDTLCPEREFVKSGFHAVAQQLKTDIADEMIDWFDSGEEDVFQRAIETVGSEVEKTDLLKTYREHLPQLSLGPKIREYLESVKKTLGLITDGRSVTQRNKIKALGLQQLLDEVVISEEFGSAKPDERNYLHFESRFPDRTYAYIGDNLAKDFVTPNRLGWMTVCLLDSGRNIHKQDFNAVAEEYLPQYRIESIHG